MFKLVKIEGSGTNQPEPIRMPVNSSLNVIMGGAYKINGSRLDAADRYSTPTHVALENLKAGERDWVLCYRITPNMIFEGPAFGSPMYIYHGDPHTVHVENDAGIGISEETEDGALRIYNRNGATKEGDLVLFYVHGNDK